MACYYHAGVPVLDACHACGRDICESCAVLLRDQPYCKLCVDSRFIHLENEIRLSNEEAMKIKIEMGQLREEYALRVQEIEILKAQRIQVQTTPAIPQSRELPATWLPNVAKDVEPAPSIPAAQQSTFSGAAGCFMPIAGIVLIILLTRAC